MANTLTGSEEFQRLELQDPTAVTAGLLEMAKAHIDGSLAAQSEARRAFQVLVGEGMALADMLGRRRVILEAKALDEDGEAQFRDEAFLPVASVAHVPFEEAMRDLAKRVPMLATSAEKVARVYIEERGFAVAASAEIHVTEKIQRMLGRAMERGQTAVDFSIALADLTGWSESYAENIYRTNLNTAYTSGRFSMAAHPEVRKVIVGMEYVAVMDPDVRSGRKEDNGENHAAANGLRASVDDPIWNLAAPPSGYQCRCMTRLVSVGEAKRKGWALGPDGSLERWEPPGFSSFQPHPNFVGSPVNIGGV